MKEAKPSLDHKGFALVATSQSSLNAVSNEFTIGHIKQKRLVIAGGSLRRSGIALGKTSFRRNGKKVLDTINDLERNTLPISALNMD